jgi:hypothetical protein
MKKSSLESVRQIIRQIPAKASVIRQAPEEGLPQDDWDGCEVEHHSESCNGGFLRKWGFLPGRVMCGLARTLGSCVRIVVMFITISYIPVMFSVNKGEENGLLPVEMSYRISCRPWHITGG